MIVESTSADYWISWAYHRPITSRFRASGFPTSRLRMSRSRKFELRAPKVRTSRLLNLLEQQICDFRVSGSSKMITKFGNSKLELRESMNSPHCKHHGHFDTSKFDATPQCPMILNLFVCVPDSICSTNFVQPWQQWVTAGKLPLVISCRAVYELFK